MATLALSSIGSSIGAGVLPGFGSLSGAALGQAAGAIAGRYVDQALLATSGQKKPVEGPRLSELDVTTSTEGRPIPRVYGRVRVSGDMIWATRFEEEIITRTQSSGAGTAGKGGGASTSKTTRTEYRYYANFAIALAEGEITRLGRVWANGNDLNLADYTYRLYKGDESQLPDSLIESREGNGNAPAYRGLAYIVFERMPLKSFGNRIPQLSFEVFRSLDDFEQQIEAVCLIPSAGEYVYEPQELTRDLGSGVTRPENTHTHQGRSDWHVSLDQLQQEIPDLTNLSLFVSWFANDLRAEYCQVRPGVDNRDKVIMGRTWSVAGESRASAHLISLDEGRAAYGGTPSDETIINAIADLNEREINVTFTPFILMDIPQGNNLPDPWTGTSGQPQYPWRGRITVNPAPGTLGGVDKTENALSQLSAFMGAASPDDFTIQGNDVIYDGPTEWSLRRMVLHYAFICKAAGGVDTFVIGSELKSLTPVRDEENDFPFVEALITLAGDVKAILGSETKVTYAADWSEYFGHQPSDGSGDVYFHLDPLWASSDIDAIGIDCYWPLSDWRTGGQHLDAQNGKRLYDLDYLQANINGGEGFDWYYASAQDREDQLRTPITDGAGKPWVFRYKDIRSWWSNQHYNRPGGVEEGTPTLWVPESKPIWFMETGCPAVHFGSNQPNLFIDAKSSESGLPYFSDGSRDDYIQRRYITAFKQYFTPSALGFEEANNPLSSLYSGRMVDPERIYIYTWDARAYPAFPANQEIWGDGENWLRGHWLNGRTGAISLTSLIESLMQDYEFTRYNTPTLNGIIEGYLIDNLMSAREALQPLELAFFFDSFESGSTIKFRHRAVGGVVQTLTLDDLAEQQGERSLYELTRRQETELPRAAKVSFLDANHSYRQRTVEGLQSLGRSKRVATASLPIVMDAEKVQSIANKWVQESWIAREEAHLSLSLKHLALEPSDMIELDLGGNPKLMRITEINDQQSRHLECLSIEPAIYEDTVANSKLPENPLPEIYGPTNAFFIDLPNLSANSGGSDPGYEGLIAAYQDPWPGEVAFYRSPEEANFILNQTITVPARVGALINDLQSGPQGRWDYASRIMVELNNGELSASTRLSVLGGDNQAAIRHDQGLWEIIQFQTATLVNESQYELSGLLRAQLGTNDALTAKASTGAPFLMLDEAVRPVIMSLDAIGLEHFWRFGPSPYAIGHPAYQTTQTAFTGRGLRPFSPVHLKGIAIGQDLKVSWKRRTRLGGDSWSARDVPLGEAVELYEVEIMNGTTPVRTVKCETPHYIYTNAEQITDWGAPQPSYHMRVYQLSEIYGRGGVTEAIIEQT